MDAYSTSCCSNFRSDGRRAASGRTILATAYVCALLSFAITVAIGERLDGLGAFRQNNLLFKDDCRTGLALFAEASSSYNTLRHPNLHFFVGHPLRLATTGLGVGAAHRVAVLVYRWSARC